MEEPKNPEPFNPYAAPASDLVPHAADYPIDGTTPAEEDTVLASRTTRLGSSILDGLLGMGAMIPGGLVWLITGSKYIGWTIAGLSLLGLAAFQFWLVATTGQSLAKRRMNIKIVRMDGSAVGFGRGVALRWWLPTLIGATPYIGGIFSLVDALLIFRDSHRCLHDEIAGTKVIALE